MSGDPGRPLGVLLTWDIPQSGRANSFNVYGRESTGGGWQLRATTTSPTFHDAGIPERQYYVATRDANGNEIANSNTVTVDLQDRLSQDAEAAAETPGLPIGISIALRHLPSFGAAFQCQKIDQRAVCAFGKRFAVDRGAEQFAFG